MKSREEETIMKMGEKQMTKTVKSLGEYVQQGNLKNNNGITLISLVVTIIVLIILATVSITLLLGENGLITRVKDAEERYRIDELKERIEITIAEEQIDQLSGEQSQLEDYKSILDKIEDDDSCIQIEESLGYVIQEFTEKEQRILRNEYGLIAIEDTTKPYGSIEKKVEDGKVILTIYTVDDESDIDRILLPDGTEKKIEYDTEKILLRYNNNIDNLSNSSDLKTHITKLQEQFKNVEVDCSVKDVGEIEDINVVVDINFYWAAGNYSFINTCFESGKNIITNGNDSTSSYEIIRQSVCVGSKTVNYSKLIENEITKYWTLTSSRDYQSLITYKSGTEVWVKGEVDGVEYDGVGCLNGENGNKWIDIHDGINTKMLRNAIYRVTGSRSATYEVTENGTYTFKVIDLGGNEAELSIVVNEL